MKQPGKFLWKGKVVGGAFGILAGPFGIFLGFLIGHLVDLIVESASIKRRIEAFLMDPENSSLSRWEEGMYSYFTLGCAVFAANGGHSLRGEDRLFRCLGEYYPLRDGDYKYLQVIVEGVESVDSEIKLPAHARIVGTMLKKGTEENYLRGLTAFAVPEASMGTEDLENLNLRNPALELLRGIAWIWGLESGFIKDLRAKSFVEDSAWEILGLKPGAPIEEIKRVFRILAAHFHPDGASALSQVQRQETEEAFRRIREAYDECMASVTRSAG